MNDFNIFDITDTDIIAQLHDALWNELVPEGGEAESIQGEMIRSLGRISSEMFRNGNNNWIYGIYDVNAEGYPEGYLPDWNSDEYDEFVPDFTKCTTTQETLNRATYFDDMVEFTKENIVKYRLDEWTDDIVDKILYSLDRAKPTIPNGVYSDHTWQVWEEQHNIDDHFLSHEGWNAWSDVDEDYANAMIIYWIYRTPDLIDFEGNALGKSVKHIFEDLDKMND